MKIETRPATLAQAKAITEDLRLEFERLHTGWFSIGKKFQKAIRARVPHALGLSFDDWVSQWAGDEMGRSTARAILKTIDALAKLPDSTVAAIPQMNALELSKLPESKRLDSEWVRKAKNTSTRDFKDAVAVAIGKKLPKDDNQEFRTFKREGLKLESYGQMLEFEERIAQQFGIDQVAAPTAAFTIACAFVSMVTNEELIAFAEGVSEKVKAS